MKKALHQKIIQEIRKRTPVSIRQIIGPVIAYILYMFSKYVYHGNWKPQVLSMMETINIIKKEKLSVVRFGDGEIYMLDGGDIPFQKKQGDLTTRLEEVLRTNTPGLLVCVPGIFDGLEKFDTVAYWFFMHHLYRNGHTWKKLLSMNTTYGETNITRPYLAYKDKSHCEKIFKELFSIWEDCDVLLIEGSKSRLGVGNDMFSNVKSLQRILCPPENAYAKYSEIQNEIIKHADNKLILLSLGPTAKVLTYDLFNLGYRVLDIGHIDMEYEMFLRQHTKLTKVPYKYFNEINERNPEECVDLAYLQQIVKQIQ